LPGFGPVRVFGDEVFTGNGTGYNIHPHHNFIIVAVILRGALTHINTIGKIDVLYPGDYYVFSAGSGGKHCELNIEQEDLNVVYIWLLPDRLMTPPSYLRGHYDAEAQAGRLACLVGAKPGALPVRQDLRLYRLTSRADESHRYDIASGRGLYLFVLEGPGAGRGHRARSPRQHRADRQRADRNRERDGGFGYSADRHGARPLR
jgi:redox-sensitive bicupin YhaK (pirin superfamily)